MMKITFAEFVSEPWREACLQHCAQSTQVRVESLLRTQLIPEFGSHTFEQISADHVHKWFDLYSLKAPAGANRALDVLSQIFNHAITWGYISINPARRIRRNKRPKLTRFLTIEEVERLWVELDAHRSRGSGRQQADIIRLLVLTGCRKGELIGLRWAEVDGDRLFLQHAKSGPRTVFLSKQAQAIILRQPHTSRFVFPSPSNPNKHRSLELSLWRKVRQSADLSDVRLHDLRHTFASHAVMVGVPLPVVSRLLGHAQLRMTLRYAHVNDRDMEAAAERIGVAMANALCGHSH